MTDALTLIDQAKELGLTLTVKDGMINAHGQRTPDVMALLEQMKPMKADILAALQPDLDFAIEDVEPLPLDPVPPMRVKSAKPPLPKELWLSGLTPADAMDALDRLSDAYYCTCGADNTGWYVRCDPKHYTVIC